MTILYFSDGKDLYQITQQFVIRSVIPLKDPAQNIGNNAAVFYKEKLKYPFVLSLNIPDAAPQKQKLIELLRENISTELIWLLFEPAKFNGMRGFWDDNSICTDLQFVHDTKLKVKGILIGDNGLEKNYENVKSFDPYVFYELQNDSDNPNKQNLNNIDYSCVFSCFNKKFKTHRYYIVDHLLKHHKEISVTTLVEPKPHPPHKVYEIFGKNANDIIMPAVKSLDPYRKKYMINIITETNYFTPYQNFSEKTIDTIRYRTPFLLVGPPNTLAFLKSFGFKTFDKYWDETYDKEKDHVKRLQMLTKTIDKIAKMSYNNRKSMYIDMQDILIHNFENLKTLKHKLELQLKDLENDLYS